MAAGDLTAIADLKAWVVINNVADDTLLARLITAVSKRIVTYCSRAFAQAAYTDAYDGKDTLALPFENFPVSAVSSLTIDGTVIPASPAPTSLNPAVPGYRFSETMLSLIGCYRFTRGYQNVIVAYTAGYTTIPEDVAQACIEWCAVRYRERDRIGHRSKSIAGETVSFDIGAMPASVKDALRPFVRVVPR
jgi:hypothetical protein